MDERKRSAGVLMHLSSLPNRYGIGSLGKEAYRFAELLAKNGVKYWQILPLVQTGYGDSPYSSVSGASGNPYLIDLRALKGKGLLTADELKEAELPSGKVDFGAVYNTRYPVLRKAFSRFSWEDKGFQAFVERGEFDDYALFMTAKTAFGGKCFVEWEKRFRERDFDATNELRERFKSEYLFWQFLQYEFWSQWSKLKKYANKLGVQFIGDIPLYVAYDSADVWARPELFKLDVDCKPVKVAGVPPDYFSAEGQLWGNPVYDWREHKAEGYAWWKNRLKTALNTYDVLRIDHFRGIDRYYEIPAGAQNAIVGEWVDGPKEELFAHFTAEEKEKIIAEDLGTVDDGVKTLLKNTGFPGMKVLLFAFDGNPANDYLPENIKENAIAYTGTHDNDTVAGYVDGLSQEGKAFFRKRVYRSAKKLKLEIKTGRSSKGYAKALVALALASKAKLAIVPLQDVLGLGNDYRMNVPGSQQGNWTFRLKSLPKDKDFEWLKNNILSSGR